MGTPGNLFTNDRPSSRQRDPHSPHLSAVARNGNDANGSKEKNQSCRRGSLQPHSVTAGPPGHVDGTPFESHRSAAAAGVGRGGAPPSPPPAAQTRRQADQDDRPRRRRLRQERQA